MSAAGPRLAITLGDPSGIGAEIVARTLAAAPAEQVARIRVFGDLAILERGARDAGVTLPAGLALDNVTRLDPARDAPPGRPTPAGGHAQVGYLEAAAAALAAGHADALITAPIHKAACQAAGFAFPGHTEFLAARAGGVPVAMMLAGPRLRVVLATIHVALSDLGLHLTGAAIEQAIGLAAAALTRDFGLAHPRLAVAGLNPHAGEGGVFGDEEARLIAPAIAAARAAAPAAEITGPHVPDAVFRDAVAGRFDAVVCMYHDQGLIPVKLVDFEEAVNVTLGLPYPRTSPDHGVAYDIAGTGRARATSFQCALALADRLAHNRVAPSGPSGPGEASGA
jgi:4-hydroxythreonine-4-phosphate dehydrogenase